MNGAAQAIEARAHAYRPDIDGFRALAVIAVVLYHFGVPYFSGGFVGVDVFFVISGYLITSIIVRDLERGRFDIVRFYERRVRRIFPALFATIAVCGALGSLLFLPHELKELGESIVAATFSVSNIYFWQETGYFDSSAAMKPLLHTWSLAVEEQFYIAFPLLLVALGARFRARRRLAVGVIFAISLGLSAWGSYNFPEATFYLVTYRAWELMLGAMLALGMILPPMRRIYREMWAFAGMGLIIWAVLSFSEATPFPGYLALAPCVGTALLIAAGQMGPTFVGRALTLPPVVLVGLISYSIYLWHWPLLVFGGYYLMRPLGGVETAAFLLATLMIAYLSWRFIEQPFRGPGAIARKPLFAFAAAAMSVYAAAAGVLILSGGLPQRLGPETLRIAEDQTYKHAYEVCGNRDIERIRAHDLCTIGREGKAPSFVIWGDSHANMYIPALARAASRVGLAGLVLTQGGCAPLDGVRRAYRAGDRCPTFNEAVRGVIARTPSIEAVFMAAYWRRYSTGTTWDRSDYFYVDRHSDSVSLEETRAVFARAIRRTLGNLNDKKFFLISDAPEVQLDLPEFIARNRYLDRGLDIPESVSLSHYRDPQDYAFQVFEDLKTDFDIDVLGFAGILCPDGRCYLFSDGDIVYRDGDHLSEHGSYILTKPFQDSLEKLQRPANLL